MTDTHGQIWTQLVAALSRDPDLLRGKNADMQAQIVDILQLGNENKFPVSRLVTVWRNERWRDMITKWCETSLGKATFQISTWEWMISNRMDDVSQGQGEMRTERKHG